MRSRSLAGMEVPVIGSDTVKWIEISVPSSSSISTTATATATATATDSSSPQQHTFAPLTEDASSCHIIGDPSTYLIWRIHKNLPNVLELMEFSACNEFPKIGLRLIFRDALCPFAFICKNEAQSTAANPYLLYTLTVSGVAFLLKLQSVLYYASCSISPQIQLTELNLQAHSQPETITSVAATMGCLVIGRHDGSICCFQLGSLDQTAPGFMHELRDDAGIGRLWGLMSRGKTIEPVQDLVISELQGRKLLFVLHGDEKLRVWDLLSHTRVLNQPIGIPNSTGTSVSRLWVGDANPDACLISLAILYRNNEDLDKDFIAICSLRFILEDKIILFLKPSTKRVPIKEGRIIDLKIACNKLWILRERVLLLCDGIHNNVNVKKVQAYGMHEFFIGEQLFQGYENSSDGLIWASDSLFSSVKDQVVPFLSSFFLRRLFHPGVFQNVTFRTTLQDYNKHWTDSEFQSLSVDDLKREILSHIESEGIADDPISLIDFWKNVCTRYFLHWYNINTQYGLLVDASTGAIGLIRHNSLSLFRCLEDIELLRYGLYGAR